MDLPEKSGTSDQLMAAILLVSESGLLLSEGLLVVPLSLQLRVGVA